MTTVKTEQLDYLGKSEGRTIVETGALFLMHKNRRARMAASQCKRFPRFYRVFSKNAAGRLASIRKLKETVSKI